MAEKDTINRLLDELPEFYAKGETSNNFGVLNSVAESLDDEAEQNVNLVKDVQIDTSAAQALNDLGRLFRLSRKPGENDADFKARIKAYWPGFSGGGTKNSFITTLNRITGVPEEDIKITEISPMRVAVTLKVTPSG